MPFFKWEDPEENKHKYEMEKQRLSQRDELLRALITAGAQPEDINATMRSLANTGIPQIPTTRMTPKGEVPVRFGKPEKKKALYQKNTQTGLIERVPLDEDVNDFTVTDVTPPKKPKDTADDTQVEIAKKVISDYFATESPDDTQRANAAKAARYLKMPVENIDVVKKHFGGLWKTKSTQEAPSFGGRSNELMGSQFQTPEEVRAAYRAGKITRDEALNQLDKMGE